MLLYYKRVSAASAVKPRANFDFPRIESPTPVASVAEQIEAPSQGAATIEQSEAPIQGASIVEEIEAVSSGHFWKIFDPEDGPTSSTVFFKQAPSATSAAIYQTPERTKVMSSDFVTPIRKPHEPDLSECAIKVETLQSSQLAKLIILRSVITPEDGVVLKTGSTANRETTVHDAIRTPDRSFITPIKSYTPNPTWEEFVGKPDNTIEMPAARGDLKQFSGSFSRFFSDPNTPDVHKKYAFFLLVGMMTDGINALQSTGYVHRDIKPANYLLFNRCTIGLTDFGEATKQRQTKRGDEGGFTPNYAPPELFDMTIRDQLNIEEHKQNYRTDCWSLAATVHEVVFGFQYFQTDASDQASRPNDHFKNPQTMQRLRDTIQQRTETIPAIQSDLSVLLNGGFQENPESRLDLNDYARQIAPMLQQIKNNPEILDSVKSIIDTF